jgi:hypothetical protein
MGGNYSNNDTLNVLFDKSDTDSPPLVSREDEAKYAAILRRAVTEPELLSDIDRAALLPDDVGLIASAIDREVARLDAKIHKLDVQNGRITAKRRRELLLLAREGKFRYSQIPIDELRAIDATAGLWSEIHDAMDAAQGDA